MSLSPDEIARRAEAADAQAVDYHLGAGSMRAAAPVPWAPFTTTDGTHLARACDCSAFVTWAAGVDKHSDGIWWGTDAIVHDATGAQVRWRKLDAPVRGCLVVYPGQRRDDVTWHYGHCGIVVDVAAQATIDCASTPWHDHHDAITRRLNLSFFWRNPAAVFVLPK